MRSRLDVGDESMRKSVGFLQYVVHNLKKVNVDFSRLLMAAIEENVPPR